MNTQSKFIFDRGLIDYNFIGSNCNKIIIVVQDNLGTKSQSSIINLSENGRIKSRLGNHFMWTVFPANSTLNKANTLNEDLEGLLFYKYVHNENLQLIAIESEYKKTGNPYSNLNLLYDNKLLVQTNLIEFKGQSQTESKGIYTYNENYDLVSYQIDNTDKTKNTSKFTSTYIYNQIGNVIKKEKSFSVDLGSFQVETNSLTSFKYNKENQMIESIEEIDSENTLIKSTVGYRNNSKHLIETIRTQSSNGDLMLTEFEYDKFERIVKVKSSDIKLNKIALTTYIRE